MAPNIEGAGLCGGGTATQNRISLKGSVKIVTEFFNYAVNSILYQRGIYAPEDFKRTKKYGLSMMVTSDEGLTKYLSRVLTQISGWLAEGKLEKLVLVIASVHTNEVLERWAFDIETEQDVVEGKKSVEKPEKEIMSEIQAIIRQITASVTFLPLLSDPCAFDLLVYTKKDTSAPQEWEDSDPRYIINSESVKLRSFTTKVHKVDTMVSYKLLDE
ncbi:mitotic spindle checkpoint protein Mad2 [Chloropicon primus]|uniref:Mitotic spindle checkpoint protein Mad2 n=1 Tax=Chloropicon primus TaxID=1764295 RepID=A0A5B8MBX9_9CHLO|nr:mitotic spindle checkpoint protein Mad2 [Chloropicon primus]UPQ97015.1 mitotic spindle checkpoint protein Mad2 [Chloropicon primus]|mmetsp:Transcript_1064/g.3148  ORF Transcript_1064/g.3148 Transcript_1064/m.3148 type:complete len:215 (+) Transcript_1064:86-730(+)|eukprot:QDZ17799.1 mitotic spindle checkpoint protein Mad2 [Chloropicon primus]